MARLVPWRRRSGNGGALSEWGDHPLARFRQEFDELLDRFFGELPEAPGWGIDVEDRDNELVVHAAAPGFEPGEFDIQVRGNYLTIHAEHKEESEKEGEAHYRYGSIHEAIPLPAGIEAEKINARYHNGMLDIHLPKGEEAKGKRIEVKSG